MKIVLGIGGSSGSIYSKLLMDKLGQYSNIEVGVVMSDNALINWQIELGSFNKKDYPFKFYGQKDFFAPFASGSARYEAMVVCPCSMGLLSRISSGISNNLMTRAADVMLKERRKLILIPRETPYNLIHLENMTKLTQAGAIICPATPSFYSKPADIKELCMTVVDRVIDLIGLDQDTYRWGKES
jgi:4-hydroxy-3-polyprenylbenzoate decarboxylase